MASRPHYIPRNKRENLAKYKYSGADHSIVSKYLLSPYWNNLVKIFPKNMAPNLITLLGLGFVLINFATLLGLEPSLSCATKPLLKSLGGTWDPLFAPSASESVLEGGGGAWLHRVKSTFGLGGKAGATEALQAACPPGWMFYSFALGLWLYQSFDAIDGKQARRTGTSGPLGELFDHGCDALNTTLECILTASALNLGQGWWTVASQVATLANFYLTTWEEWHTGTLFLSAFSGPVEGILMIIVIFTITGAFGPAFWDQGILTVTRLDRIGFVKDLPIKNLPLNEAFLVFGALGLAANIIASYSNVIAARRKDKLPVVTPLLGLLPFVGHTVLNVFWLRASPLLLRTHLIPFMIFWGLSFAYLVGLLIVSHVVQAPEIFPWWHILMIWSLFGCVDANLPHWTDGRMQSIVQKGDAQTVGFVWVSVAVALAVYGYFVTDVILDVCDFCDINCLTIKKKKAPTDGGQGGEDKADGGSRGASDKPSGTARRRKQ